MSWEHASRCERSRFCGLRLKLHSSLQRRFGRLGIRRLRCGIRKTLFAGIPLPQGGKDICAAGDLLVLCNRYGLPIAARSLGEFQEASEAPVSIAILAERATPKFDQRTAARKVELKMARRLRCVSVTGRKGHAPSSRLGGGHFELNDWQAISVRQH